MHDDSNDGNRWAEEGPDITVWRKASFSYVNDCVELAHYQGGIGVRDTKQPDAGVLVLTREQLADWIAGIKAGEFDDLA